MNVDGRWVRVSRFDVSSHILDILILLIFNPLFRNVELSSNADLSFLTPDDENPRKHVFEMIFRDTIAPGERVTCFTRVSKNSFPSILQNQQLNANIWKQPV